MCDIPVPLMSLFVCRPGKNSSIGIAGQARPSNFATKFFLFVSVTFLVFRRDPCLMVSSTRTNFGMRTTFFRTGSYVVSKGRSSLTAPVIVDALFPTILPQRGHGNVFCIFPFRRVASQKTNSRLQFGQNKAPFGRI